MNTEASARDDDDAEAGNSRMTVVLPTELLQRLDKRAKDERRTRTQQLIVELEYALDPDNAQK